MADGRVDVDAEAEAGNADVPDGGLRAYLSIYLKGVAMGAADAVPGVSGGTIALVTGIYERLVSAITDLEPSLLADLVRAGTPAGRETLRDRLSALDLGFLFALGLGIVTALVTVSRLLEVALDSYTALTFAFFFGLIAASAVVLYGEVAVGTPRRLAVAALGFLIAFLLTGEVTATLPNNPAVAFVAGAIAISAMILPGISGSFLLLVLGQYEYVIGSISGATDAVLAADSAALLADGTVLFTFGCGAVIGILSVTRVIEYALEQYRAATVTFLVSLMIGALRLPVERVLGATETFTLGTLGGLGLSGLVGGLLVLGIDHATEDIL